MAEPYLTTDQARARLADFGIAPPEAQPFAGDLRAASDELDSMAPFLGVLRDPLQHREWPRVVRLDDLEKPADYVPDAVLDWVALRAYQLSTDEEPAVKSEGAGRVSVTYLHGKFSQTEKRMSGLLDPYLLRTGSRA